MDLPPAALRPACWEYVAEGNLHIVLAFAASRPLDLANTVLRLRKRAPPGKTVHANSAACLILLPAGSKLSHPVPSSLPWSSSRMPAAAPLCISCAAACARLSRSALHTDSEGGTPQPRAIIAAPACCSCGRCSCCSVRTCRSHFTCRSCHLKRRCGARDHTTACCLGCHAVQVASLEESMAYAVDGIGPLLGAGLTRPGAHRLQTLT